MAAHKGSKFDNATVVLDGHQFVECEFTGCRLVYRGGELPALQHCHFMACTWLLEDAALRAVQFLRGVYHSGPGGKELVEDTLRHIRIK
jgi:hypothetical protein